MLDEDLPFKVVRTNLHDEVIARAENVLVGRAGTRPHGGSIQRIALITARALTCLSGVMKEARD